MITPVSPPENHYLKITGESFLQDDGSLKGKFRLEAEGQSDSRFRRYLMGYPEEKRNEFVVKSLVHMNPLIEITKIDFLNPYNIDEPMYMDVEYFIPEYAAIQGKFIFEPFVGRFPFSESNVNYFMRFDTGLDQRKYPFRISSSKQVVLNETIHIPADYSINKLPEFESIDNETVCFQSDWKKEDGCIKIKTELKMKKRIYEKQEYPSFKKALEGFKESIEAKLLVEGESK